MSCLFSTRQHSVNGDGVLHITSGIYDNPNDLSGGILRDTLFHSSLSNIIKVVDTYTHTVTSNDSYKQVAMAAGGYANTGNLLLFPSGMHDWIVANNYAFFGYMYVPALNLYIPLNLGGTRSYGGGVCFGAAIPIDIRPQSSPDGVSIFPVSLSRTMVQSDGSLSWNNNKYSIISSSSMTTGVSIMSNRVGSIIKLYKVNVSINESTLSITPPSSQFVNDIEITNRDVKINGVSLSNQKLITIEKGIVSAFNTRVSDSYVWTKNGDGNMTYASISSNFIAVSSDFSSSFSPAGIAVNNKSIYHLNANTTQTAPYAYYSNASTYLLPTYRQYHYTSGTSVQLSSATSDLLIFVVVEKYNTGGIFQLPSMFIMNSTMTSKYIGEWNLSGCRYTYHGGPYYFTRNGTTFNIPTFAGTSTINRSFIIFEY